MSSLYLDNISCRYQLGQAPIVDGLSLRLAHGDIACLLGPSGCGKTTILRAIAGFQSIYAGSITIGDQLIASANDSTPPEQRQIGLVFQDYALFPHLSVADNVCFALKNLSKSEQREQCARLLELVQLPDLEARFPHELSGGQQQRVALARALAAKPRLLLLDEPFSNLDVDLRRSLAVEVKRILKLEGITAIMVTHDQEEAFAFADQIAVMHAGKIHQMDTPFNLYHQPNTEFVANFIGKGVLLAGEITGDGQVTTELGVIGSATAEQGSAGFVSGQTVKVLVRPDDVKLAGTDGIAVTVEDKIFAGTATQYTLKTHSGQKLLASLASHHDFELEQVIQIELDLPHLILL